MKNSDVIWCSFRAFPTFSHLHKISRDLLTCAEVKLKIKHLNFSNFKIFDLIKNEKHNENPPSTQIWNHVYITTTNFWSLSRGRPHPADVSYCVLLFKFQQENHRKSCNVFGFISPITRPKKLASSERMRLNRQSSDPNVTHLSFLIVFQLRLISYKYKWWIIEASKCHN